MQSVDDEVIVRIEWYYEHRGYYKHSFLVLTSERGTVFAVEKNDYGVVWQSLPEHSTDLKVEHDGSSGPR